MSASTAGGNPWLLPVPMNPAPSFAPLLLHSTGCDLLETNQGGHRGPQALPARLLRALPVAWTDNGCPMPGVGSREQDLLCVQCVCEHGSGSGRGAGGTCCWPWRRAATSLRTPCSPTNNKGPDAPGDRGWTHCPKGLSGQCCSLFCQPLHLNEPERRRAAASWPDWIVG